MMKKGYIYIIGVLAMMSCSSDIAFEYPDNYSKEVCFSVGSVNTTEAVSRAHDHSVAYDQAKHANHLVVFGYGEGNTANEVFSNVVLNYDSENKKWATDKYWAEIAAKYKTNDFFAYMVEDDTAPTASVTNSGNVYTLTFTPALPALAPEDTKWLFTGDNTPLICHAPVHKDVPANLEGDTDMKFYMDQTLTGYTVWFQLGDKMDKVRDFEISKVHISGTFPLRGTVSKKYTLTPTGWAPEKEEATWTGLTGTQSINHDIDWGENKLLISQGNNTDYKKWGGAEDQITAGAFFTIPFTPGTGGYDLTIKVTYDVVLNGADKDVVTRKDVVSTIQFNSTNFTSLVAGTTGNIHPIKIKIVPDYLYVLADKDQSTGYLIINQE